MDNVGNQAETISVQDVDYITKELKDVFEYELKIHFISDQGQLFQTVVAREFENEDMMNLEIERYGEIVGRTVLFNDITPKPLVKVDALTRSIVLEKIEGSTLDELGISQELKDFILGRIYGILHGNEILSVSEENVLEFFKFLLTHLRFTDEEKNRLVPLLQTHFTKFSECFGGFTPQTIIVSDHISFRLNETIQLVDKEMIAQGHMVLSTIKSEIPDELTDERMRDIAYYFHDRTYLEFMETGNINKTIGQMKEFFEGYLLAANIHQMPPLNEVYPSGITLDIQLLFVAWLREVEKIQKGENILNEDKDLLRYSYFLLTQNPLKSLF
ncbi:MAG: hypothetical protein HeimC2_00660 [Candidatus Heimdallarchaeota archaeon LC_2]|nr:MAG: hypothetical protein HeimC2_00660 [Candidatus Heimdallarchaeota archaeon LC_2]